MNKKSLVLYFAVVLLMTIVSILTAEYIQTSYSNFAVIITVPISIIIVPSYLCGSLDYWRFIFAGLSIILNLLIYIPILKNHKFKSRIRFISTQAGVLVVYAVINLPVFWIYAGWMSV